MWENNGRLWKLWPLQQALVFFYYVGIICSLPTFCRLQLFVVLDPGRLSGTFFRLFNHSFLREWGGTINTQGNCAC